MTLPASAAGELSAWTRMNATADTNSFLINGSRRWRTVSICCEGPKGLHDHAVALGMISDVASRPVAERGGEADRGRALDVRNDGSNRLAVDRENHFARCPQQPYVVKAVSEVVDKTCAPAHAGVLLDPVVWPVLQADVDVARVSGFGDVDLEIVVGGEPEGIVDPLDVSDLDPRLEEAVAIFGLAPDVSGRPVSGAAGVRNQRLQPKSCGRRLNTVRPAT